MKIKKFNDTLVSNILKNKERLWGDGLWYKTLSELSKRNLI
jgi:hypothetical protein